MMFLARLVTCLAVIYCLLAVVQSNIIFGGSRPRQPPTTSPRPPASDLGSSCQMPGGKPGLCKRIQECASLLEHLRNKNYGLLKQLVCGKADTQTLLCCPDGVSPPALPTPDPSPGACGISKLFDPPRVVGGQPVNAVGTFPWMAALQYSSGKKYQCGAAVIGRRWLLTASHCVNIPGGPVAARIGDLDLATTTDDSFLDPPQDVEIERLIRHPEYRRTLRGLQNDVALIKLKSDIQFSDVVRPICLPPGKSAAPLAGQTVIAGWGLTSFDEVESSHIMQYANLNITDIALCQRNYFQLRRHHVDREQHVCASGNLTSRGVTLPGCLPGDDSLRCQGGIDSCRGDSGGPLMAYERLAGAVRFSAVGIVSFAVGCGSPAFPGIYTRVDAYMDWIRQTVAGDGGR